MSFFTKPATTIDATVDPRLPVGYDDPESRMFIPEKYREAYTQTERPDAEGVDYLVESFAKQEVTAAARAEHEKLHGANIMSRPFDLGSRGAVMQFEADKRELLRTRRRELEAVAEHHLRATAAEVAVTKAEYEAKQRDLQVYSSTCQGCLTVGGSVTAIPQDPSIKRGALGVFQSATVPLCADCAAELRAQQSARAQARTDAEARSRIGALLDGWGE
jgi:hypothetical protein